MRRRSFIQLGAAAGIAAALPLEIASAAAPSAAPQAAVTKPKDPPKSKRVTPEQRKAAAKSAKKLGVQPGVSAAGMTAAMAAPGAVPHYFGPFANYANSPLPSGSIATISIVDAGMGYVAPRVEISDVYGIGAGATATIDPATQLAADGSITGITLGPSGSGYFAPIATIFDGSGSGAAYKATFDTATGAITGLVQASAGSGYTNPVVEIVDALGGGYGATVQPNLGAGGEIASLTLVQAGSGYQAPAVVITDGPGTGASASVTLAVDTTKVGAANGGGIRKFVDTLAGLDAAGANTLGKYIPVAVPDKKTYPGCDYYEIELGEFDHQFHTDLPTTKVRGYRQTNGPLGAGQPFQYLGPLIVATRNTPVRVTFTNRLSTGGGGDLFIPVDETVMGAGMGPTPVGQPMEHFKQNRATLHLHGGFIPWISDGTPHQWTTPATETTSWPKGVSVKYVPDMWFVSGAVVPGTAGQTTPPVAGATNNPGDGSLTFYYNNEQSARLMFYHDHAWGITRLNVYAGEAAGYLLTDQVEQDLINGTNVSGVNPGLVKALPDAGIPLIIQDKTFVDSATIAAQDPFWRWGTGATDSTTGLRMPRTGDLWVPSVYMPAQNPWDISGASAFGRWQYGPWFWPPTLDIKHPPIANPYSDPANPDYDPWEPPMMPDMPSPSMGMEAFNDTPIVNGTAYPTLTVDPKAYRFRILNAANDRFVNLQLFVADPAVTAADGRTGTEVKMVDALVKPGMPATWPNDGRAGGAPDPAMRGPAWLQIGTEGGFLPMPVVIKNQPINWNMNATAFNVGNVTDHSLLLGCAERADVLVDFTPYAGQTLILYNDAPAAFPALDPRYDYYTGCPDQMDTGGAPSTQPGYGPNTRTIMQIKVTGTPAATTPVDYYDPATLTTLNSIFAKTATKRGVFEVSQDNIIVPQAGAQPNLAAINKPEYATVYNKAYNLTLPSTVAGAFVKISDTKKTFTPIYQSAPVTITFNEKAIHDEMGAAYDLEYGRMGGLLGLELLGTNNLTQNIMLYPYVTPPVDVMRDSLPGSGTAAGVQMVQIGATGDGTQIWKITHNGVDTHPMHFHLFNVQIINRVAWDGMMLPPDANELGWKETVRTNPLESLIVAMRPSRMPLLPFELPNSVRPLDPSQPLGATLMGPPGGFTDPVLNGVTVTNHVVNFGWEYVWHCHILSHEEMDMMHPLGFAVAPKAPGSLSYSWLGGNKGLKLTWTDASVNETAFIVRVSRDLVNWTVLTTIQSTTGSATGAVMTYTDTAFRTGQAQPYYYQVIATNVVGDTKSYTGSPNGFPKIFADSVPAQVGPPAGSVTVGVSQATLAKSPVVISWTYAPAGDQKGYVVQRSTTSGFTSGVTQFTVSNAAATSYNDTSYKAGTTYYYRVAATNDLGRGAWSAVVGPIAPHT